MKTRIFVTALSALTAFSNIYAQTPVFSEPSGYTTQKMKFSFTTSVGFNILSPALAAGTISAVSGDSLTLTDSTASLDSVIPSGKMCTIEITSGTATGAVREFDSFTPTSVSISAVISGLVIGDKYTIRKNATVQEIFPVGLLRGALGPTGADIVWVPDGIGGYTKYWYRTSTATWWTTIDGTSADVEVTQDIPLLYTDAILVQRKTGTDTDLILDGQVKTTRSTPYVIVGFNDVSINPPVGLTLFSAGLAPGGDFRGALGPTAADLLWVPDGIGGYTKYWYRTSTATWWTTIDGTSADVEVTVDVDLPPGCIVQRKNTATFMSIAVPSSYSNL